MQVALEAGAVVRLEAAQLVDLVLQAGALLLELDQGAVTLVLGLMDDLLASGAGLGDDALALRLAVGHVLVVQALGQFEHTGGGGGLLRPAGLDGRDRSGLDAVDDHGLLRGGDGGPAGLAELGDPLVGGLELGLEVLRDRKSVV